MALSFRFKSLKQVACWWVVLQLAQICCGFSPLPSTRWIQHKAATSCRQNLENRIAPVNYSNRNRLCFQNNFQNRLQSSESSDDSGEQGKLASSWENAKSGALFVQNNFWNQFWYIHIRTFLALWALQVLVKLPYALSPRLGTAILRVITTAILAVDSIVSPVLGTVVFAFLALFLAPMKAVGIPLGEPAFFPLRLLILTPIVDELIFRQFIFVLIKRLWNESNEKEDTNAKTSTKAGYSSVAIVSSLLFAFRNISSWAGPLRGLNVADSESFQIIMRLVNTIVFQFMVSFLVSIRVFIPTFENNGLAGSIAAHSTWNLSILTSKLQLGIRGMNRLLQWLQNRSESNHEEGD